MERSAGVWVCVNTSAGIVVRLNEHGNSRIFFITARFNYS